MVLDARESNLDMKLLTKVWSRSGAFVSIGLLQPGQASNTRSDLGLALRAHHARQNTAAVLPLLASGVLPSKTRNCATLTNLHWGVMVTVNPMLLPPSGSGSPLRTSCVALLVPSRRTWQPPGTPKILFPKDGRNAKH